MSGRGRSVAVAAVAVAATAAMAPAHAAADLNRQDGVATAPVVHSPGGWVGLTVDFIARSAAQAQAGEYTVVVGGVEPGGPAWEAGISAGDTLMFINGEAASPRSFTSLRKRLRPGDPLTLELRRTGERQVHLTAAARPVAMVSVVPGRISLRIDSMRTAILRTADSLRRTAEGQTLTIRGLTIQADTFITVLDVSEGVAVSATGDVSVRTGRVQSVQTWAFTFEEPGTPKAIETLIARSPLTDSIRVAIQTLQDELVLVRKAEERRQRSLDTGSRSDRAQTTDRTLDRLEAVEQALSQDLARSKEALRRASRAELEEPHEIPKLHEVPEPPSPSRAVGWSQASAEAPFTPYLVGKNYLGGAKVAELNEGLGQYFDADEGVLVTEVAPWSVAAESGLEAGDVIIGVDGHMVATVDQLRERLVRHWDGAVLSLIRKGEALEVILER